MSYFINICSICLKQSSNLVFIRTKDTNGTSFEDKLKYFIPALEFKSTFPKYICAECRRNLRKVYEFKQICLRNMTTYENYAQQVATINGCHKYLSVTIRPDFVYKEEISDGNNYDASVLELKSEIDVNIIESEELIIKEETNEDLILNGNLKSSPRYIEEENIQSGDTCPDFVHIKAGISDENNYDTNIAESQTEIDIGVVNREEFFIKEEKNEKLVLEDKLEPLLYDTKQDNPKSNFTCKQTENIVEGTAQISDVSITQLTENKNICEQREFTYNEKLFECETCNNSFEYSRDLERHQLTHTKKLFTCKICGKSVKNLKKHNLTHGKERPHKCEICNKSFRVSNTLQRHYLIHTDEKPFTCEVCNKSFRRSSALKIHKLIHTGEKPFTCENCNKSFRESSTLKKHKLVHTGRKPREKPFTCEVCNKSFGKTNTLNRHRVTHTGEKPYTCEICKKSFPRLFTLKNHQLLHTSEKPYTCEICDKKFRQLANLKRHKIVHTSEKPYTCEICNTPYRWLSNLSKHKLVHTGEKPYTCEVCNKSFTAKRSLQKHSKIHSN